jgi:hypothetical protein
MKESKEMSGKECFFLFCLCIVAITGLVLFALHKGVDGMMFGSGMSAIVAIAVWIVRSLIQGRKS